MICNSNFYRSAPFSFADRVMNVIELMIVKNVYLWVYIPGAQKTAEKHLGIIPDLAKLCQNTTLVLLNSHFSINHPRPLNPNVVEVGGINVVPPKTLPSVSKAKSYDW